MSHSSNQDQDTNPGFEIVDADGSRSPLGGLDVNSVPAEGDAYEAIDLS